MKTAALIVPPYFFKSGTELHTLISYLRQKYDVLYHVSTFQQLCHDKRFDGAFYLFFMEPKDIKLPQEIIPRIYYHAWFCKRCFRFSSKNPALIADAHEKCGRIKAILKSLNPEIVFINQLGEPVSRMVYYVAKTLDIPVVVIETGFLNGTYILDPISMHFFENSYFYTLRNEFEGDKDNYKISRTIATIYRNNLKTKWENHNPASYNKRFVDLLKSRYKDSILYFGQTPWDANISFVYDNPVDYKEHFMNFHPVILKPHPTALSGDKNYVRFLRDKAERYSIVGFSSDFEYMGFFDVLLGCNKFYTVSSNSFNDLLLCRFLEDFEWLCDHKYSIFHSITPNILMSPVVWDTKIFAHIRAIYEYCFPCEEGNIFYKDLSQKNLILKLDNIIKFAILHKNSSLPLNETFYVKRYIAL